VGIGGGSGYPSGRAVLVAEGGASSRGVWVSDELLARVEAACGFFRFVPPQEQAARETLNNAGRIFWSKFLIEAGPPGFHKS